MIVNFSLRYQHIANKTGDENKESHQVEDIVLMCYRILKTYRTGYEGRLVSRVDILIGVIRF